MTLKVISYNCRGIHINSSSNSARNFELKCFLDEADILLLQEVWLYKQELKYINNFDCRFHGTGEATRDAGDQLHSGHPPGGVAIFWKTCLESQINELKFNLDWIVGISIKSENREVILLCVYLPHQSHENEDEYLTKIGQLLSIINSFDCPNVIVTGDVNADVQSESLFGRQLKNICDDNELIISTVENLPNDSFTYVSESWGTTSWLDHCISTRAAGGSLSDFKVKYEVTSHDHIPIEFRLNISRVTETINNESTSHGKINWDKLPQEKLLEYIF